MPPATPDDVLDFWFSDKAEPFWFKRSDAFDRTIAARFAPTVEAAGRGALDGWAETAGGALALVIVLDQFPRNLHRGSARAFESDPQALAHANSAIAAGFDRQVPARRRQFFYLPLMHSEDLADQERCVALYEALGDEYALGFAREHRDIVARFGRFPHRNAVLGRESSPAEREFLTEHTGF